MPNAIDNLHVRSLSATRFTPPAGSIGDDAIEAAAGIAASKLEHQFPHPYRQAPGSAIVAATEDLHIVQGAAGSVVSFEAAITGAIATGGDRTVTVDLQKSTGGGAFATVLSAAISFSNADTLRTAKAVAIASASLVAGDIVRGVVAVAGAAGSQAQGLIVTAFTTEGPA